jgi:hypothetical protein
MCAVKWLGGEQTERRPAQPAPTATTRGMMRSLLSV